MSRQMQWPTTPFACAVRAAMREQGIASVRQFAPRVGLTDTCLRRAITGERFVSAAVLAALCAALPDRDWERLIPLTRRTQRDLPETRRFWLKVNAFGPVPECRPDLGPCWLWLAHRRGPYGRFKANGRSIDAHCYAYQTTGRPVPHGYTLDHLCRVQHCVNPDHLEPVTRGENTLRGDTITGRNLRKTQCVHGHPFNDENTRRLPSGGRACKTCERTKLQRRRAAQRVENIL